MQYQSLFGFSRQQNSKMSSSIKFGGTLKFNMLRV